MWAVSNRGQTVQPYPKRRTAQTGRGVGRNIWQAIHYIYIGTERIKVYGSQTICRNVTVILQELQIYCKQKIDLI